MYIRRKVFSLLQDEYGEERYFSTTDIELQDDERMFSWLDEAGNLHYESGKIVGKEQLEKAEDLFGDKKGPKKYKSGTPGGKQPDMTRKALTDEERKALKKKVGKRTAEMKNWNKSDSYKQSKYEASKGNVSLKERLSETRDLKNKLEKSKALNKGLMIGLGAAGAAGAGYGIYRAVKAKKAKKEQEEAEK